MTAMAGFHPLIQRWFNLARPDSNPYRLYALSNVGSLLALPAGLLAAAAFFGVVNFPLDFVTPWRDLAVIGLGLPAFVYAGSWLVSRPRKESATQPAAMGSAG